MKIGILTFHRAHNYGAVLQCYALQEVLKSMGHEVQVIDYRQRFIEEIYSPFNLRRLIKLIIFFPSKSLIYLKTISKRIFKKRIFTNFIKQYLSLTGKNRRSVPQMLDRYIIGSDQLWSLDCTGGRMDHIYLGNFKHTQDSKIIGYAISTNTKSLNTLKLNGLSEYVQYFQQLSMREQFAVDFISKHTKVTPSICIDPTLLADAQIWEPLINKKWEKQKYILMYQVRYPNTNSNMLEEKAQTLAQEFGCKVIDLSNMTYSVEDFVSLFKYAQYVVTTSFHATVFSIIFETPFYSIKLNDGHDERYVNLIRKLDLDYCCVNIEDTCHPQSIDYISVKNKLNEQRKESLKFLSEM